MCLEIFSNLFSLYMNQLPEWQSRTELLTGAKKIRMLQKKHVLVSGLGGVGAYAAEMLCRGGIGELTIVDSDRVQSSNRNRQLIALLSTEGLYKTDVMEERLRDINPDIKIHKISEFIKDERIDKILETRYDYVVDAIDTLSPKVSLLYKTRMKGYPLISCMGSGGRLDPAQIHVSDISDSYNCKLAYSIRKQLHKLNIRDGIKVVFSTEKVSKEAIMLAEGEKHKRSVVGTISYMPSLFGIYMAGEIIRDLINEI